MLMSPLHEKCTKCGSFYLEIDNKDKVCSVHPGNIIRPGDDNSDVLVHQCCMKAVGSRGCGLQKHIANNTYRHNFGNGAISIDKEQFGQTAMKEALLKVIENYMKAILIDVKKIYALMEQKNVPDVVQCCKEIVGNIKHLEVQATKIGHHPFTKAVDAFKAAVAEMIKTVQIAGKSQYTGAVMDDVKKSCNSTVAAARNVVIASRDIPAPADLNVTAPKANPRMSMRAPPGPPGPPPGPPGMGPPPPPMGAPPPSSGKGAGRNDLLNALSGFSKGKLKKATTVDKSKPVRTAEIEEGTVDD